MGKILCFISEDMADFEITLAFHKIKSIGNKEVLTIGYDENAITSESGIMYKPHINIKQSLELSDVEGLIIPGGPIKPQKSELTELIKDLDGKGKLLAAICNGPQYLGRAGILKAHKFTTSSSKEAIHRLDVEDPFPWENYVDKRVVRDSNIITAKGRAFVDFAFEIFDYLDIYKDSAVKLELYKDIVNFK